MGYARNINPDILALVAAGILTARPLVIVTASAQQPKPNNPSF
jgi:hypothetical protein